MIRILENQERLTPPEGADLVSKLKRRSETESRDFALKMNEAIEEKEKGEENGNNKGNETPMEDSVELSTEQEESETEEHDETPRPKQKLDKIDITV